MIIYLTAVFISMGFLSTIFNSFFSTIFLFGFEMPFNVSVLFFCMGFFTLDLVTELYDDKLAKKIINAKILSQLLFVGIGGLGVHGAGIEGGQLDVIISSTPYMIFCGIIASLVGYNLSIKIMQKLKVIYSGKFLALRYLASTLPGELVFSAIFSALSFSAGKDLLEYLAIFFSLALIKIICSIVFAILAVPVTIILRTVHVRPNSYLHFVPFQ